MGDTTVIDTYHTIANPSDELFKEKNSKFYAYAFEVTTIDEVEACLTIVKEHHSKAGHHCYAYRLGIDGEPHRANDDGEPSGTAGRPILGQIRSHELSDVLVVVARYFGGVKLGASGLISAYRTAAGLVLERSGRKTKTLTRSYRLAFEYGSMGHVLNVVKQLDIDITSKDFADTASLALEWPIGMDVAIRRRLIARLLNIEVDQVTEDTPVPFCTITPILTDA